MDKGPYFTGVYLPFVLPGADLFLKLGICLPRLSISPWHFITVNSAAP